MERRFNMWKTAEYAGAGRGHLEAGIPCQDKVRTYRNGEVTVITLADGAGSARLSHFGAEAVLKCISQELGEHFEEYFEEPDTSVIRSRLISEVRKALEETQNELQCELKDLSSTMLAAAVSGFRYFIAHIGDGVIGYLSDDEIKVATGPDNGEFANVTFFTTTPSSLTRMRIVRGTDDRIGGFALMSDGTETALYNKRTGDLSQGIKRIMQMTVLCPEKSMRRLLSETFETTVMNLTRDDCSIAILVNTKAFPDYHGMPVPEKMDLLQIGSNARNGTKRLDRAGEILRVASGGASAEQIARLIHVKPKHIRKKLDSLIFLGLLEKDRGIYYSALGGVFTPPKSIHHREREENNPEKQAIKKS